MNSNNKLNINNLSYFTSTFKKPFFIAGPCGAETEEQVISTAKEIAKIDAVSVFRLGIWKPRTRPNSFEGAGSVALEWLKNVKKETGLLTTVEVGNAKHVEEALKGKVDILWIGARTTVNPFYVQEIADSLKGVDVPVMVKNPINPDLNLWIGAFERLSQVGINNLIAIHRGFYPFENSKYRNPPQWEIPIQLKNLFPELPIICDPSHIAGNKNLVASIAQKAMDLDMVGLMIETHIDPEHALSDADQQLTPLQLKELLANLTVRESSSKNKEFKDQLLKLRSEIDDIDDEIIKFLSKRLSIIEQIGIYKKENNVTILQIERWKDILLTRTKYGEELGLKKEFIEKLCQLLHQESIRLQTEIMNKTIIS